MVDVHQGRLNSAENGHVAGDEAIVQTDIWKDNQVRVQFTVSPLFEPTFHAPAVDVHIIAPN